VNQYRVRVQHPDGFREYDVQASTLSAAIGRVMRRWLRNNHVGVLSWKRTHVDVTDQWPLPVRPVDSKPKEPCHYET
jgi:hypothetical protein